jgi:hypothetical protein
MCLIHRFYHFVWQRERYFAGKILRMCISFHPSKRWFPFVLVVIAFGACSPKLAPEGHYQDSPVTPDGVPGEWKMPLRFTNTAYTMQYNVTNDDQNIYVAVSSLDDITQLRILRSGMTIYFDPKGKKNKDISLHFPIQKQPDPNSYRSRGDGSTTYYQNQNGNQNGNQNASQNRDTRKEELLLQSDHYNTTGFTGLENGQFSVGDPKAPIHIGIKLNNQDSLLVYEVVIPLRNILGPDWAAKAAKKNFSVGVVMDAVAGSGGGGSGGRPGGFGGMRGMGMRGMGGGGMGGGGRRYGGGQQAQKEDANWYAFRLATK